MCLLLTLQSARALRRAPHCRSSARGQTGPPLRAAKFSSCLGGDGSFEADPIARSFLIASSPLLGPRSIVLAPGWRANPLALYRRVSGAAARTRARAVIREYRLAAELCAGSC